MSDGIGCVCGAHGFAECGCLDVDWTPSEVKELSDMVEKMRKALQITLGNIRSLAAAGNCRTFDEWEKAIIAALEPPKDWVNRR